MPERLLRVLEREELTALDLAKIGHKLIDLIADRADTHEKGLDGMCSVLETLVAVAKIYGANADEFPPLLH